MLVFKAVVICLAGVSKQHGVGALANHFARSQSWADLIEEVTALLLVLSMPPTGSDASTLPSCRPSLLSAE